MGFEPLLEAHDLVQQFEVRLQGGISGGVVQAVSNVSLSIGRGETVALVGESGSGKSTFARSIIQSPPPKSGQVWFLGEDLTQLRRRGLMNARRQLQMVFQDPFASLNPEWRVRQIVEEPLVGYGVGTRADRRKRVDEVLNLVGLNPQTFARRRPSQLSGGQCQRVAIARALTLDPALIICDEAVSALDVIVQAQILNLFEKLRAELGLSYLFVSHDLALVRQVSDRVAVMHLGEIVEVASAEDLYRAPAHPYTLALLESSPSTDPAAPRRPVVTIKGDPPSPLNPPSGCRFRTRCPMAQDKCAEERPRLTAISAGHQVACHFPIHGDPKERDLG
ncbi:ABC transporter ATP-binding protein [Microbacterium sp. USTB-Y]|uniref:ABC transporter ATP-binding protein n=1 Tax=Microbacterium sp. USTB-Y TaxID=2823692 RepID=UPI00204264B0|nr:oligopeptide/dipeptide ABC transporter ATP-binding protein [Microbacterium sp. USTB-Y]